MAPSALGSILAAQAKEPSYTLAVALSNVKHSSFH